jgi:uncharacterized repeat protein (TIGR01451 family)
MKVVAGANLGVSKFVKKTGTTTWGTSVTGARPGDNVTFSVGVKNNGGTTAGATIVKDRLPNDLYYKAGTTKVKIGANGTETPVADGKLFTTAGLPVTSLAPAGEMWVIYDAQVNPNLNAGNIELSNLAEVWMDGTKQGQGIAVVYANGDNPGLNITKGVFEGTSVVEHTTANLLDTVKWQIILANTGNTTQENVTSWDVLPLYNNYVPGSLKINNVAAQDSVFTEMMGAGHNFGQMLKNQSISIVYQTKIYGCVPVGGYEVLNTAHVKSATIVDKLDTAGVKVNITAPTL